jgi:iron-sulfur cluster repair protein YtfE (RIC family)
VRRSAALAILSRDHHQALFVAHRLRRADAQTAAVQRARFLDFWEREGRHHFQLEEELLLPAFAEYGDAYHPLLLRVLGDHVSIRAQANRLTAQPDAGTELLERLGTALATHVRLEERELFPLIEETIPPAELLELAHALAL